MSEETKDLLQRAAELYERVLAPLLLSGHLRPVRPIGPVLAKKLVSLVADHYEHSDQKLQLHCDELRLRQIQRLTPLDSLPALSASDWMLLAAFNDLLQSANPHLSGTFTSSRPVRLLQACENLLSQIHPPQNLLDALTRHAIFAHALEVRRTDTQIRWWTGSAMFYGEPPSKRLTSWPDLRRVQVTETTTKVEALPLPHCPQDLYLKVLASWLALSPLTDLAYAGRSEPAFYWTSSALSLLTTREGRRIVRHTVANTGRNAALNRAAKSLESTHPSHYLLVKDFLDEWSSFMNLSSLEQIR